MYDTENEIHLLDYMEYNRSYEGPTLEISTFQLFTVANLSYQLN